MKTIVITGGTKGIGRAIADIFAKEGNWKIVLCARNADDLKDAATALSEGGNEVFVKTTDMSEKTAVLEFADFINTTVGTVDILVNNAGVFLPGEVSLEDEGNLEMMINTNLYSAYYLTRALLPMMKKRSSGHIFNMCSIASKIAYPNGGSYSISKFALLGFSKVLREEMKPLGIKVSSILPGATWSNSWAGVDLPESRLMKANDIAKIVKVAYELSDSAVMEDIVLRPQLGDL
jgi:short-subunit dehydrogenase